MYLFCYAVHSVFSSFEIIPLGKRRLIGVRLWSSECHVVFYYHIRVVGWSVVSDCGIPGHTRLLFVICIFHISPFSPHMWWTTESVFEWLPRLSKRWNGNGHKTLFQMSVYTHKLHTQTMWFTIPSNPEAKYAHYTIPCNLWKLYKCTIYHLT